MEKIPCTTFHNFNLHFFVKICLSTSVFNIGSFLKQNDTYILKKPQQQTNKKFKIFFGPKGQPNYFFSLAQWLKHKNLMLHLMNTFPSLTYMFLIKTDWKVLMIWTAANSRIILQWKSQWLLDFKWWSPACIVKSQTVKRKGHTSWQGSMEYHRTWKNTSVI